MFCPECGTEISDTSKFCIKCGHSIESQPEEETPPVNGNHNSTTKVMVIIWVGFSVLFGGLYLLGNVLNVSDTITKVFGLGIVCIIVYLCWKEIIKSMK